jgi:DNA repair exonuclease SbcCD ATPase subunit
MPFKGEQTIEFDSGVYGIVGEYVGEPDRSNRSGKTSFIEAVCYCLYGESRSKKEIELIHNGQEDMFVEVTLQDGSREATILRYRNSDNTGGIEFTNFEGEKKKAAQDIIDKFIGLDFEGFLLTSYFKQDDIQQFLEAGPQQKKEILLRWLQLTDWSPYEEFGKNYRSSVIERIRSFEAQRSLLDTPFDPTALLERRTQANETIATAKVEVAKLESQILKLKVQHSTVDDGSETKKKIAWIAKRIYELKQDRPQTEVFDSRMEQIESFLAKYEMVTPERLEDFKTKHAKLSSLIIELNLQIRQTETERETLRSKMTGMCPILKKSCDLVAPNPDYLDELAAKVDELQAVVFKYKETKDKAEKWIELSGRQQKALQDKKDLLEKIGLAKVIEDQIAENENERKRLLESLPKDVEARKSELQEQIDLLSERLKTCRLQISAAEKEIGNVEHAFILGKENETKLKDTQAKIEELTEHQGDVDYVLFMMGKNGISSLELENSFQSLEDEFNFVLRKLKAPYVVELKATRETQEYEAFCLACKTPFPRGNTICACGERRQRKRRDELALRVLENGIERPWYLDSGGGKVLLSFAIRIALTRLAQKRTGTQTSFLFLDEILGSLDPVNRASILSVITNTLAKDFGFSQIFLISHTPEVQQTSMTQVIKILRNQEGYSEIKF